ncbi:MAG: immunity 49 family protein [Lachnospiraceae bacterium]|nr:immunity 49 family protein [Lachnospiraceae bacterium]
MRAYREIIERDEAKFDKGLEYMPKHHVARMRRNGNYLEKFFACDSVALAMLAKDRGMVITVKHDLLPMEYLENTNIDYSKLQLSGFD